MSGVATAGEDRTIDLLGIPIESETDLRFEAMGTSIRLLIGPPARAGMKSAPEAAADIRAWIEDFDRRLSRFRPQSELSRLNAAGHGWHPASPLLIRLIASGLEAAELTGGVVDPAMLERIEGCGYRDSRPRTQAPLLAEALTVAPDRRPAGPDPRQRWRGFRVDSENGRVLKERGLGFDSGGIGKGLAADMASEMLAGHQRFLIDCGGDIRVGGPLALLDPYRVRVAHPLDGSHHRRIRLATGAVATSGIDGRIWRRGDGFSHHILDPATGRPAWTGVISATAIAPTAVEAEARAKAALLAGPLGAGPILGEHGGLIVTDSGESRTFRATGCREGRSMQVGGQA